jgi:hypothetical protein
MTERSTGTHRRPRADTARDRLVGDASTATVVSQLGTPLVVPNAIE